MPSLRQIGFVRNFYFHRPVVGRLLLSARNVSPCRRLGSFPPPTTPPARPPATKNVANAPIIEPTTNPLHSRRFPRPTAPLRAKCVTPSPDARVSLLPSTTYHPPTRMFQPPRNVSPSPKMGSF